MRRDDRKVQRILREEATLKRISDGHVYGRDYLLGLICRASNVSRQTAFEDIRVMEAQALIKFRAGYITITAAGRKRVKELRA